MLGVLGVERALPFGVDNDEMAQLLRRYPGRILGLARISALKGMGGVRELESRIRAEGFHALGVSALVDGIPASDRRFYQLYTKAAELKVRVRVYSFMN
jgi:predicted TIM-barrel fold metal-dependent hydrolase